MAVAAVVDVSAVVACTRKACNTITDSPDGNWIVIRPLVWNAFLEEQPYCCPACLVVDLEEKHRPEVLG